MKPKLSQDNFIGEKYPHLVNPYMLWTVENEAYAKLLAKKLESYFGITKLVKGYTTEPVPAPPQYAAGQWNLLLLLATGGPITKQSESDEIRGMSWFVTGYSEALKELAVQENA